jgi:hypothetical protein
VTYDYQPFLSGTSTESVEQLFSAEIGDGGVTPTLINGAALTAARRSSVLVFPEAYQGAASARELYVYPVPKDFEGATWGSVDLPNSNAVTGTGTANGFVENTNARSTVYLYAISGDSACGDCDIPSAYGNANSLKANTNNPPVGLGAHATLVKTLTDAPWRGAAGGSYIPLPATMATIGQTDWGGRRFLARDGASNNNIVIKRSLRQFGVSITNVVYSNVFLYAHEPFFDSASPDPVMSFDEAHWTGIWQRVDSQLPSTNKNVSFDTFVNTDIPWKGGSTGADTKHSWSIAAAKVLIKWDATTNGGFRYHQ